MTLDDLLGPRDKEKPEEAENTKKSDSTVEIEKTDNQTAEKTVEKQFQKNPIKAVQNTVSKAAGHDRGRIKNITNLVHPEEDNKEKAAKKRANKAEAEARRARKKLERKAKKAEENIRRQEILEKRKERQKKYRYRRWVNYVAAVVLCFAIFSIIYGIVNYNQANKHDSKGMTAYQNDDYETAIAEFKDALSYDSENAEYFIHLGMAYIETKSFDEALGYFNQAEKNAVTDEQKININRARGIAHLYNGDYEKSISCLEEALNLLADSDKDLVTDICYYKAEAEEKFGDYQAAVSDYTTIYDISGDVNALLLRAHEYELLEDYANQEADLRQAIKGNKKNYSIYRSLYNALMAQNNKDAAIRVLNDALSISGSSGSDYFNRGMICIDIEDYENAKTYLEQSIEKGYDAALLGLGELYIRQNDYTSALEEYKEYFESVDIQKEDKLLLAKAYNQYAVCLLDCGNYDQAIEMCQNGLALNQRSADSSLTFNIISAYESMGEWSKAYNMAKSYVDKYPDDERGINEFKFLESRVVQ